MTLVAALAGVSTQASAQVPLHDSRYEMVTTQLDQNISFGASTINYLGQIFPLGGSGSIARIIQVPEQR